MPGTLHVCATPIGNLEDVSLRLLATLREVALICAEDTRHTQRLLARHDIHTPLASCHEHTHPSKIAAFCDRLEAGDDLALVTDAGTPGVSDPGPALVLAAAARGLPVVAIPGPCAAMAALSLSGCDGQRFSFLGFLPRKPGRLRRALQEALERRETLVLYESPYRVTHLLEALADVAPEVGVVVCRELTKKFEETKRGTAAAIAAELRRRLEAEKELRGEFVVVIAGAALKTLDRVPTDDD